MNLLHISSAVVWVDFFTIGLHRMMGFGNSLEEWYSKFGLLALLSDCLVIIIGILMAKMFFPTFPLLLTAVAIQLIHDMLFYLLVILPIPRGHNTIIDLFKDYASENGWGILVVDSLMIGSTVLLGDYLSRLSVPVVQLTGLSGLYALTYILYTK
jgi:hypothetical protein